MYDYIFVTHLPSFYKTNLYNRLAQELTILAVYIGDSSFERNSTFTKKEHKCDVIYLSKGDWENVNVLFSLIKLFIILITKKSKVISVNGWDRPEFWLITMLPLLRKKALVLESGLHNSKTTGLIGLIKKFFLKRVDVVFASGEDQKNLASSLNFKNIIYKTYGVGIINNPIITNENLDSNKNKFLYIGRLSKEKNIKLLLDTFANLPNLSLTLIGEGPLIYLINNYRSNNLNHIPHVANTDLHKYMLTSSALILPSKSEVWGLVVEEAILHKLPVICSCRVGASELIKNYVNGIVYERDEEFFPLISKLENNDQLLSIQQNMLHINFEKHILKQYSCYIDYVK